MTKKLLLLIAIVCLVTSSLLFAGGMSVQTSGVKTEAGEPISTIVRNTAGEAMSEGDVVVWQTNASLSATTYPDGIQYGVDISTPQADNVTEVAGVLLEDIADGEYGSMAIYGYVATINVHVLTAIGDSLVASSGAEEHCSAEVMTAGSEDDVFAICFEAQTDSTTVKGWLCR